MISCPKVSVLPVTDQVIERVEAWAAAEGVTSMNFFDKKRDLETFQDGDQIAGVDDTEQGYLEEAFDQDYEPEDEDERGINLHGQFDDIDDSKREELLADADNDVNDMPELTVRFQGDDDYESDDDNSGDEGNDEEETIVADLDHHQENVDRGTNDMGPSLLIWRTCQKKRLHLSLKSLKWQKSLDLMSSHMDPKVNDKFAEWLNMRYGSIKACTIVRGKIHRYLGMTLDFSVKGKLKIRMDD
ncbi:unnamed protein product [Cylindrotheca closterium]|uniref:Uncharacterized protein n=1 Tax=Cylindrotheca closterium TaxID=2856 RepID=A0AAD2CPX1_9STRA|nr:unnamed protein product [Cylindrotheca closterium]